MMVTDKSSPSQIASAWNEKVDLANTLIEHLDKSKEEKADEDFVKGILNQLDQVEQELRRIFTIAEKRVKYESRRTSRYCRYFITALGTAFDLTLEAITASFWEKTFRVKDLSLSDALVVGVATTVSTVALVIKDQSWDRHQNYVNSLSDLEAVIPEEVFITHVNAIRQHYNPQSPDRTRPSSPLEKAVGETKQSAVSRTKTGRLVAVVEQVMQQSRIKKKEEEEIARKKMLKDRVIIQVCNIYTKLNKQVIVTWYADFLKYKANMAAFERRIAEKSVDMPVRALKDVYNQLKKDLALAEPIISNAGVVLRLYDDLEKSRGTQIVRKCKTIIQVSLEAGLVGAAIVQTVFAYIGWKNQAIQAVGLSLYVSKIAFSFATTLTSKMKEGELQKTRKLKHIKGHACYARQVALMIKDAEALMGVEGESKLEVAIDVDDIRRSRSLTSHSGAGGVLDHLKVPIGSPKLRADSTGLRDTVVEISLAGEEVVSDGEVKMSSSA